MENKYEIKIEAIDEDDLKNDPWFLNALRNKVKQVFMTPGLVIIPGKADDTVDRLKKAFEDPGHTCQLLMGIPGGFLEYLVDNKYIVHFIFMSNIRQPNNSKVSVLLTKIQISPIANSDTEDEPMQ